MKVKLNVLARKQPNKSLLDCILEGRGITDKNEYFSCETSPIVSCNAFSDMNKAVEIIKDAIKNQDKILVWGDFDADGVTSTSIIYKALNALGANHSFFLPDRIKLGHGLNLKELLLQKSKNNLKVLITVDCGISNVKEINLLKSMGVKVILTDHHEPPKVLPDADCILNPLAPNSLKSDLKVSEIKNVSYLAGAGVALSLAYALLGNEHPDVKDEILALASLGTIADVVPLIGENRKIASQGIKKINDGAHKGIKTLFDKLNLERKLTSEDVAFILAPRINAAGRLSTPYDSIKLLIEDSTFLINESVEKLEQLNRIRQGMCDKVFSEAVSLLKAPRNAIVLYNPEWHMGIIGIVASKLVERFNLPVFLITSDENNIFRCSARGTEACNISKVLDSMKDCFLGFGGHMLAGGFSADSSVIDIKVLTKRIFEAVCSYSENDKINPSYDIDIELDAEDITKDLVSDIEKMQPFGANNRRPIFLFTNSKVVSQKTIGKEQNHLAFSVLKDDKEFSCIYWKRKVLGFNQGELMDFAFKIETNTFNNEEQIQLITEYIINDRLSDSRMSSLKIFDHRQKTGIIDKINSYIKDKEGDVRVYASTIQTKRILEKYPAIKNVFVEEPYPVVKSLMLFDIPPSSDELKSLIVQTRPECLHLMNAQFSRNPDDYILLLCGMLKFASNKKAENVSIATLARNMGLDEQTVQILLEILERIGSINIIDIDKFEYIKPPTIEAVHADSMFEIFSEELKRINIFKDYIKSVDINTLNEVFDS